MEGRSLREISIDMKLDRTYVRMAIEEGNHTDWKTIKAFMSYLGYDVKFVYVTLSSPIPLQSKTNILCFHAPGKQRFNAGREVTHPSPLA